MTGPKTAENFWLNSVHCVSMNAEIDCVVFGMESFQNIGIECMLSHIVWSINKNSQLENNAAYECDQVLRR